MSLYCSNLRRLKARNLSWTKVSIENFPKLKKLDLSHSQIHQLSLANLPELTQLKLNECRSLTHLANIQRTRVGFLPGQVINPYELPKLAGLEITDCTSLTGIRIICDILEKLKLDWVNCHPQILIDWLKFLYHRDGSPETQLFSKVAQALQADEKIVDLSAINLKVEEVFFLKQILQWNLPIRNSI